MPTNPPTPTPPTPATDWTTAPREVVNERLNQLMRPAYRFFCEGCNAPVPESEVNDSDGNQLPWEDWVHHRSLGGCGRSVTEIHHEEKDFTSPDAPHSLRMRIVEMLGDRLTPGQMLEFYKSIKTAFLRGDAGLHFLGYEGALILVSPDTFSRAACSAMEGVE